LNGLTGKIRFDQRGRRASFGLDLMELSIDGLKKVNFYIVPIVHNFRCFFLLPVGLKNMRFRFPPVPKKTCVHRILIEPSQIFLQFLVLLSKFYWRKLFASIVCYTAASLLGFLWALFSMSICFY